MGTDFVEFCCRVEEEFGLDERELDLDKLEVQGTRGGTLSGATAADIARWVEVCIVAKGNEPLPDLWPRVQACIAATVSVSPAEVALTSRIIEDLEHVHPTCSV